MTIQDLGSLGELVAAIATVVTLAYLALQIRANTKAIQSESRGRISSQFQGFAAMLGGSKEVASIFTRGLADFDSLDSEEQIQFAFLFSMLVNQTHDSHYQYRLGVTDRESMEANTKSTLRMLQTPGGRAYWQAYSSSFGVKFQEFVNDEIKKAPNGKVAT